MRRATAAIVVGAALAGRLASASPNVSLDDPVYDELADLHAEGLVRSPYDGGSRPLTRARIRHLLRHGPAATGFWFRPVDRLWLQLDAIEDHARPYNTPLRPRDLVGALSVACERQEGRPCGTGAGLVAELDASAGYRDAISVAVRLRSAAGVDAFSPDATVDRLYANGELGIVAWEVGRDALQLGPASFTQAGWGSNAPTLDMIRLSSARPLAILGPHGDTLRASVQYVLGRLRAPQTYPGNLVSITRAQLDIADKYQVGMMQFLQLEGEGAPSLGVWGFIEEHVHRSNFTATEADSSNRRIGFDFAVRVDSFHGARAYYQLVFEDWRRRFHEALRFEADHVIGLDFAALGARHRTRLILEFQETGIRSHEHHPRVTGFTNRGSIVGNPLGPDGRAMYAELRLPVGIATLAPWLEVARLQADTYTFVEFGPQSRATEGPEEWRYRVGARLRLPLGTSTRIDADAFGELVDGFAFEPGARRWNEGLRAAVVWTPH